MSFYGTTFYEFKKIFNKILTKNNNSTSPSSISTSTTGEVEANSKSDAVTFFGGNHWIRVKADDDGVKVEHAEPTATDTNKYTPFTHTPKGNGTIASATELQPGDYITVASEVKYDKAGHIINSIPTKVYQLPQTDTEVELETIENRLDVAEKDIDNIETNYAKQKYVTDLTNPLDERLREAEQDIIDTNDDIETNYAKLEMTGETVDLMLSDNYSEKFKKITEIIGNIEELNQELGYDPKKRTLTLCESLKEVIVQIKSDIDYAEIAIKGLDSRLQKIEDSTNNS